MFFVLCRSYSLFLCSFERYSLSVVLLNFFFGQYTLDECGDGALSAASSFALAINICYVLGAACIFLYYFIAEMKAEKARNHKSKAQEHMSADPLKLQKVQTITKTEKNAQD